MPDQAKSSTEMTFIKEQITAVSQIRDDFTVEQMKFVKGLVNPDLTDSELLLFLGYASKTKLNPFSKEIIAVVYSKDDPANRRVNTIVTRDGKRVVASRTGELTDIKTEAIYIKTLDDKTKVKCVPWEGELWGAESTVTRKDKLFKSIVPLKEYDTNRSVWIQKKSTMIKKVAESQALSAAFPEILGGMYDESEVQIASEISRTAPTLIDGDKKATEAQLATLESLGANMSIDWTKQTAAEEVTRLMSVKGKDKV